MVVAGQRFANPSALHCVGHRIPAHPIPLRSAGGRQGPCQPRKDKLVCVNGCGAVTRPASRPPPCHFAPDKDKVRKLTPSGRRVSLLLLRVQRCPRPYRPENALSIKSVREHFQVGRAARRWQVLVGVRWQWFQCRVAAFHFQRVSLPMQFWRACGFPSQFRPRLPWWLPFVWRWLVLSGWLR